MNCPNCSLSSTIQLSRETLLGYKVFRCRECHGNFNERTGTQFNHLQFPTDIVLLVVLWRLRYKGYTACATLPRCFWCVGSSLHMKRSEIGNEGSLH
jgi:hypothetical protein